jgi:hypothetical protein
MDPIFDNLAFLTIVLFVYFVAKATLDPQCENWGIFSGFNLQSLCSGLELHRVGMQVHHG